MNKSRPQYKGFDFGIFLKEMFQYFGFDISEKQIRQYIHEKGIQEVEFDFESDLVFTIEPILHGEQQFWINQWLKNELSSEKLLEKLLKRFQLVEYIHTATFLEGVRLWLQETLNIEREDSTKR